MLRAVARVTVFGAGAAGTALAIHLARKGEDATLWASEHDGRALQQLEADGRHPALNERLPATLKLHGPDALGQAAAGVEVAVLAANSGGARSLAGMVTPVLGSSPIAVSIAKGLEPESMLRMSQVYGEALPDSPVVALSGPSLATEIADGLLTAVAMACPDTAALDRAAEAFRSPTFLVDPTDDVIGVEVCGVAKNVAAIAAGVLEGMQQHRQLDMKNARAAMFTRAVHEMADLVGAMGGRPDTAFGLAGMGDLLVTSLGGRNRLYGETIGLGAEPTHTLQDMIERGLTVEGAESALDVHRLATDVGLDLPVHEVVYRVVHEGAAPESILEAL
jgi:glycerol-3-phosphate dehydrogenase (NAD(P)+)